MVGVEFGTDVFNLAVNFINFGAFVWFRGGQGRVAFLLVEAAYLSRVELDQWNKRSKSFG